LYKKQVILFISCKKVCGCYGDISIIDKVAHLLVFCQYNIYTLTVLRKNNPYTLSDIQPFTLLVY